MKYEKACARAVTVLEGQKDCAECNLQRLLAAIVDSRPDEVSEKSQKN